MTAATIISTWNPVRAEIESITNANPGVVTTTTDNGYLVGSIVRLVFPQAFGMPQVNGQVFSISILSDNSFSLGVDTTKFDPFVITSTTQVPQVIPVGEQAFTLVNAEKNTLPVFT